MKTQDQPYLTLREASEFSRLGLNAIRNFIYDGLLPSYKPRKVRLVKREELIAFIESRKTKIPANSR